MIEKLKDLIRPLMYRAETVKLMKPFFKFTEKNLASFGISKSREKMRTYVIMQVHIIEKGLSLSDVKPWFGQPKIATLIKYTKDYFIKYGDYKILYLVCSTIQAYFDYFNDLNDVPETLLQDYNNLKNLLSDYQEPNLNGGVVHVNKVVEKRNYFDFSDFAASRHSVRSFTGEPVNDNDICDALKISETTPSACNRQPWYNYVITDKNRIIDILATQQGSRQFKEQVSALIITASSSHFFFDEEYNQMYFNVGLYSMNLMYALHSKGLGIIPLNMGISEERLKTIRTLCGIPDNQMPISLIAIGTLPQEYKYAKSPRFSYMDYTKFDR